MEFLLLIFPVILLLCLSAGISKLFGYKIEQSHFISVCIVSLTLIVFGLIGILTVGLYLIVFVSITSLIYLIIIKYNFFNIFSPAICGYLLGLAIYAFFIRDIKFYNHDEYSHWAYASKMMYLSGDLYKGIQTAFTPAFNFFIAKTSVYTEGNLYSGAWILLFSCFMLPLGGVKWDKWKMISIYYFAQYCLLGVISATPKFYSDELLGFMSAALCAFFALKKGRNKRDYVLVIMGLLALAQVKDSYGAVFAVFSAIFIIVTDIMSNFDDVKKVLPRSLVVFAAPFAGYIVSLATLGKPEDYFSTSSLSSLPILELLKESATFLGLSVLSVVLFVLLIIFISKKREVNIFKSQVKFHNIIGILLVISISFLLYKIVSLYLVSLSYESMQSLINDGWKGYFYNSSGGINNKLLYPILGIFATAVYSLAIKNENKKIFVAQMITLFLIMISITAIVLFTYSVGIVKGQLYIRHSSWERYIVPPTLMTLSYIASYFINTNNTHINDEKKGML